MQVLIYKNVENKIIVFTPVSKDKIQQSLNKHSKSSWINKHANAPARHMHNKRIAWANAVTNFNAITDAEFKELINCEVPHDSKYSFWIDQSKIPAGDANRDAWSDIDEHGNVKYDSERVAQIQRMNDGHS